MKKILSVVFIFLAAITIVACGGGGQDKKDVLAALEVATKFSGNPETEGITRDQSFPTKLRDYEGVELVWSSSNPAILANDGKVTRPAPGQEDAMITMTVTASKNKAKESETVKFKVLAEAQAEGVTLSKLYDDKEDISTAQDGSKFKYTYLDELVEIEKLTVVGIYRNQNGFYLSDGVRLLFVYNPTLAKTVKLNEVYDVKGTFGHNFGSAQLSDDTIITKVEGATPSKAPLTKATVGPEFISTKTYGSDNLYEPIGYELTGKVMVDTSDDSQDYQTYLVAPDYAGFKVVKTVSGGKAVAFLTETVNVYYQGLVEPIKQHNGKTITATYFPVGLRSDRGQLNYGVILDEESIKVKEITPAEEFANAQNFVKADYAQKMFNQADGQINLYTEKDITDTKKATYSWASETPTVIDNEGNILAAGLTNVITEAKFKVTITYPGFDPVVIDITFEIMKDLPVTTALAAGALAEGEFVKVVVKLGMYQPKNYLLVDASGSIASRDNKDLLDKLDKTKTYEIVGEIGLNKGIKQILIMDVKVVSTEVTPTTPLVITKDTVRTNHISEFANITGTVSKVSNDNYNNTDVEITIDGVKFSIRLDERIEKYLTKEEVTMYKGLVVGDNVTITNIAIAGDYANLYLTSASKTTKVA